MAFRIPQSKVEEIYAAADIVDVVADFVQLKKRGANFFGLSPFSNEKSPSFTVSPSKNIFKDFSSGRGGNAVTFLMELEGMTYVESLQWLARKYGIEVQVEETAGSREDTDKRESLYVLNEFAVKWFRRQLTNTDEGKKIGLSYFRERGLLENTMEEFQLGYSPEAWDAFAKTALESQFKPEFLTESGLCFKSERDGRILDRYRERIIFPLHNHMGKVVGFAGRIIGKKDGVAKYVNSPETPVYHKSKVLYGLHQNKQTIRDLDQVLLVEGYMDLIALYQNGIRNVVASSGTALTEDQIKLLKRFSHNVLLVYDADPAGIRAALRGVDLLIENELKVRVLVLPQGQDPDSFVMENGQEGFEKYAKENARDFIEFKIAAISEGRNLGDPAQRAEIVHETASTLAKIPDPVLQGVYVAFTAEKLGIPVNLVESALKKATSDKLKLDKRSEKLDEAKHQREVEKEGPQLLPAASANQEKEIMRLVVNYAQTMMKPYDDEPEVSLAVFVFIELADIHLEDEAFEKLRTKVEDNIRQHSTLKVDLLFDQCKPEESAILTDLLLIPPVVSKNWGNFGIKSPQIDENPVQSVQSALNHFRLKKLKVLLRQTKEELKTVTNAQREQELIETYMHLNGMKIELSQELGIVINE